MKILRVPHFNQFLLVYLSPFSHELSAPFWKSTLYDIEIVKLHDSKISTILDMDVSWWMLTIDQEHPDHNSVEASNFWHGFAVYWMCQRPTLSVTCRVLASRSAATASQNAVRLRGLLAPLTQRGDSSHEGSHERQ